MSQFTLPGYPLTSVFHLEPLKAPSSDERNLLIFIPGNPGLIEYYTVYLELLQKKHPTFEVYCISHAGYQTTGDYILEGKKKEYGYYDLPYQVHHKVEIIKELVKKSNKKTNLHIYGHSMGCYIMQRVVKPLENSGLNLEIKFLGLICPTVINIRHSSSGRRLVFLSSYLPIVQLALFFVWIFNYLFSVNKVKSIIGNYVFSKPVDEDPKAWEAFDNSVVATAKLGTSHRIVKQALTMAIEEMEMILEDDELNDWFFEQLPRQGTKIWVYFAYSDYWVHDNTRSYILGRYHNEASKNLVFQVGEVDDGITHSFCVDQSVEFSRITVKTLEGFFGH